MKQFMITVLAFLGIQAFAKDKDGKVALTEEQLTKLKGNLGEDFTEKFVAALSQDPDGNTTDDTAVQAMITAMNTQLQASVADTVRIEAEKQQALRELTAEKTAKEKLTGIITEKDGIIATLTKKPEADPDPNPVMKNNPKNWVPSGQDTHLFGESQQFFAIDDAHGYNRRAYASIAARHGIEMFSPRAASSLDYSSLGSDLGEYYRIRKQDRVQSFLMSLPSLTAIFTLESGYQDQAVLVNMFLTDDFSQADSTSLGSTFENVVKGGYKFEPETLTM